MMKKYKNFKICYFTKLETIQEEELYDNNQIDEDLKFVNDNNYSSSDNNENNNEYTCFNFFKIFCCFKSCWY
jgi:hypothetical protein